MAVGQTTFTVANGAVLQLHAGGNMADYLSGDPDATAFRYTSVRFTSFGMAWFFENFDKGAASYLGETLTYTASRNCDIHEMTLFRYELPGIGNFQYAGALPIEVLHDDICPQYYAAAASTVSTCISEGFFRAADASTSPTFLRRCEGQPYYTDGVALAAVKGVEYKVGGQRMDRHDKYALYTWILLNSGSIGVPFDMCGLAQDTGNKNKELKAASMSFQVKYCPLIFSFCRAPSMGAPLISNMYNNLIIEAEFETFSSLICNYSGAGANGGGGTSGVFMNAVLDVSSPSAVVYPFPGAQLAAALSGGTGNIEADIQVYTLKRTNEGSMTAAYARGRDMVTSSAQVGTTVQTATATNALAQTDFPVSVVSRVFFLGPEERTAFASNSFSQTVEACQRVKLSASGGQTSQTYRTDTFQNASSVMYVVPTYKNNLLANDYFSAGGTYDLVRGTTFPAINTLELSTNGATLYAQSDESFYRMVQPYAHHSNVLDAGRRVYAFNFGTRANSRGPVQAIGYLNFSRTTNSQVTATHPASLWSTASATAGNPAGSATAQLDMEFILWNYNLLTYKGGIAGYRYTQSNNSL
jgi:hypothetical protein